MRPSFFLAAAALMAPPTALAAQPAWIATCDMGAPGPGQPTATRVFRVGAGLLQEWRPERKAFGANLCLSFSCKGDRGTLQGRIESASLIFTLSFDPRARTATWQTVGASGLARTSGTCVVKPEPAPQVAVEGKK